MSIGVASFGILSNIQDDFVLIHSTWFRNFAVTRWLIGGNKSMCYTRVYADMVWGVGDFTTRDRISKCIVFERTSHPIKRMVEIK